MSFTTDIKKEIINHGIQGDAERKSALSAFVRTSGNVGIMNGSPAFYIVSETENVTEFFMQIFSETFGVDLSITRASMDRMSRRDKLLLQCPIASMPSVVKELGFIKRNGGLREGIASSILSNEEKGIAYIKGAFLGGGSCTLPRAIGKTGYHLEIVFMEEKQAKDFRALLAKFELLAKLVERKDTYVVYLKSKEMISDFLAIIGANHTLEKFSSLVEKRDEANQQNRARNCNSGNAEKTATASENQYRAIIKLKNSELWSGLCEELKEVALAREAHKDKSMQALADYLNVSKSCLNHRVRRLMEMATKLDKKE